jgi:molecular chaperone DnaJ
MKIILIIHLILGFYGSSTQSPFHSTSSAFASKDPYSVLGVKKDASGSEIKKAYYAVGLPLPPFVFFASTILILMNIILASRCQSQLAKKYHPDINKESGAKERYQSVQEAYDVREFCFK